MTAFEFIKALKTGKTTHKEWVKIISSINRLKLNDNILNEIHVGIKNLSESDTKKIADSK